eukprot:COSAG01_NODE_1176_length_11374_cov_476.847805_3_plen_380_part_00
MPETTGQDTVKYQNPIADTGGAAADGVAVFDGDPVPAKQTSATKPGKGKQKPTTKKKSVLDAVKDEKGIAPESAFSVDTFFEGMSSEMADFAVSIRTGYEAGFMRIRGSILTANEPGVWRDQWKAMCEQTFSSNHRALLQEIGWTSDAFSKAARRAIAEVITRGQLLSRGLEVQKQLDAENAEKISSLTMNQRSHALGDKADGKRKIKEVKAMPSVDEEDVIQEEEAQGDVRRLRRCVYRMFVKTRVVDSEPRLKTIAEVESAAREYAGKYASLSPDDILGDEWLDLKDAAQTVTLSVEHEQTKARNRLTSYQDRQERGKEAPVVVEVSGLTGDSAEANGVYSVGGLRLLHGRPTYVRRLEHADEQPYYIFCECLLLHV